MKYYLVTFSGPGDTYEVLVLDELPYEQVGVSVFVQNRLHISDAARFSSTSKSLAVEFAKYIAKKEADSEDSSN